MFLDLPREMRDMIYNYYVHIDGGYIYNYKSGKFQAPRRRPINISLMYTCRLVAAEMQGVAIRENTITFTTACEEDFRIRAGRYDSVFQNYWRALAYMLAVAGPKITPNVTEHVAQNFPVYLPIIEGLKRAAPAETPLDRSRKLSSNPMGEAISTHRNFLGSTLRLLAQEVDLDALRSEEITREHLGPEDARAQWQFERDPQDLLSYDLIPWKIPKDNELDHLEKSQRLEYGMRVPYFWNAFQYHISAAAVAIQFLSSIPVRTRKHIRDIILHEDKLAVARPESHALGLIDFCLENPQLRIERRVNLWRSVFPAISAFESVRRERKGDELKAKDITEAVTLWISEADALTATGMPSQAFSLILDCDQIPERTAQIFEEVVQRDAIWEAALDKAIELDDVPRVNSLNRWHLSNYHPNHFMQDPPRYRYRRLFHVLCNISTHMGPIRCNFHVNPLWEIESNLNVLLEEVQRMSLYDWSLGLRRRRPTSYQPGHPHPSYTELRLQQVLLPPLRDQRTYLCS